MERRRYHAALQRQRADVDHVDLALGGSRLRAGTSERHLGDRHQNAAMAWRSGSAAELKRLAAAGSPGRGRRGCRRSPRCRPPGAPGRVSTPVASCSSGRELAWVVVAGWMTRLRTSPMLATWLCSSSARRSACRLDPALDLEGQYRAGALGRVLLRQLVPRAWQAGVADRQHLSRASRNSATSWAFAKCRSMRRLSVSRPWSEQERVERRSRRADVAQHLHAGLEHERAGPSRAVGPARGSSDRVREAREAALRPVEGAAVEGRPTMRTYCRACPAPGAIPRRAAGSARPRGAPRRAPSRRSAS